MNLPVFNTDLLLDEKGRVMVPRAVRDALDARGVNRLIAFANGGPRGGLSFCRIDDYEALVARHQGTDPLAPQARLFALAVASTAQTVNIDSVGRMLIPQELRALLGLQKELYLFTAGTWFEIWDKSRWLEHAFPKAAEVWDQLYGFSALAPPAAPSSRPGTP
jgi:MraZ protein